MISRRTSKGQDSPGVPRGERSRRLLDLERELLEEEQLP
jgi:hypothetical protein